MITDSRLVLITLLIKLGVATAVSSTLGRSRYFQSLLFREERTLREKSHFLLFMGVPLALGVLIRLTVHNFLAADIGFEAAILMGVISGRFAGAVGGALLAVPAVMYGEYASLPFYTLVGFTAGMLRMFAGKEEIWSFSPFIDLSIYRWVHRNLRRPRLEWQTAFFFSILALQFLRMQVAKLWPGSLFALDSANPWVLVAIYADAIMVVAAPLKIWNNTRIEIKLEEQERLLSQARLDALQSQINPHFLFNTLNSISSLVRFDPDKAREVVLKLANILRRLLRKHDDFVRLRDEIEFIDDYLDIEVIRFGRDKLRVIKELDPATLDVVVPSMILQPLVENSIKHGLAPKIEGGSITLRSGMTENRLWIEVEDDGVGVGPELPSIDTSALGREDGSGIGMNNVAERLRVLYGEDGKLEFVDTGGKGTRILLQFPVIRPDGDDLLSAAAAIYEARQGERR